METESLQNRFIREIRKTPANRLQEVLDFWLFLNSKGTPTPTNDTNPYPLRGLPIQYLDPTEPVTLEDRSVTTSPN
jgi:hypothetical protein